MAEPAHVSGVAVRHAAQQRLLEQQGGRALGRAVRGNLGEHGLSLGGLSPWCAALPWPSLVSGRPAPLQPAWISWGLTPGPSTPAHITHATLTGGDCQGPSALARGRRHQPWPGPMPRVVWSGPEHPGASALGTPAAPHPAPPAQCCLRPRVHPAPQPPRRVLLRHQPLSPSRSGAQEPSCLRAGEPRLRPGSLGPRPVPATTGASPTPLLRLQGSRHVSAWRRAHTHQGRRSAGT